MSPTEATRETARTWGVTEGPGYYWSIHADSTAERLEVSSDPLASPTEARAFAAGLVAAADWREAGTAGSRSEPAVRTALDPAYTTVACTAEVWAVQQRNGNVGRVVAWREVRFIKPGRLDSIQLDPVILWPGTVAASTGSYSGDQQPELFGSRVEADVASTAIRRKAAQ
jgi:hypothetical protein